jgi:hypothetical protein
LSRSRRCAHNTGVRTNRCSQTDRC